MLFPSDRHAPPRDVLDFALRVARFIALVMFLGGLAALSAMWLLGPVPQDDQQWRLLLGLMRSVFYPCVLFGLLGLVIVGVWMWLRRRREFNRQRWFRLMMVLLLLTVPPLHFFARYTSLSLGVAIEASDHQRARELWNRLGASFSIALIALLAVCAIGILKPRLGQQAPIED